MKEVRIGCAKNAFNMFIENGRADPIPYFVVVYDFLTALSQNHCSSGKLSKHAVNNIGMRHRLSINENKKSPGKNLEKGLEVANSISYLFDEGGGRFGVKIKAGIKCRGEDDENPKI